MAHDILVPHGPPARTTRQVNDSQGPQRNRQGEAPKHGCRQVTHDSAGHSSQGTQAFQETVLGGSRGTHAVAGVDEIPGPGSTSAQPGGAGLGHGEGLVSKLRGQLARKVHTSILAPSGEGPGVIHSVEEECGGRVLGEERALPAATNVTEATQGGRAGAT